MNIKNIMDGVLAEETSGYSRLRFESAKDKIKNECRFMNGNLNIIDSLYSKFKFIDNDLTYADRDGEERAKLSVEQKNILKEIVVACVLENARKNLEQVEMFAKEVYGEYGEEEKEEELEKKKVEIEVRTAPVPVEASPANLFRY